MVCPPVQGDNPRVLASGLFPVQADKQLYNYFLPPLPVLALLSMKYRKNSKNWDTSNNCHNCPKNRKVSCNIALMHPKDAD